MARLFSPRPPPSEDLFYETYYSLSQQYPLLLLLLVIVLVGLLALLAVAWASGRELASDPGFLTTMLCGLGGFSLLLSLASREQRLQRWTRPLSGLVWAALLALGLGFLFTGGVVSAWDQVSFFLFVIFTVYAMLPLGMRDAAAAGLASSLSHLLVLGLYLGLQPDSQPALLPQLAANAVLFLCGNVAGAYHKALMERALRATFREALSSLHSRRRLDTEKKHQEHLLLSILPAYLAREMKAEIMARLQAGQGSRPESTNNFHSLYVKRHQGVSVLYADIVGFTRLASECSPKELVLMLNELFGKFDQIAKEHECMRIKILGDCYYCVSGLPLSLPDHAINCVRMGLDMCRAIRKLRAATGVDINMRVGVHSGSVLCGVIGLQKWQYDVWSHDVTLANHMEASGVPGRVHITGATLALLAGAYAVEDAAMEHGDPYLRELGEPTYLVIDPRAEEEDEKGTAGRLLSSLEGPKMRPSLLMTRYLESWGAAKPFAHLSHVESPVSTSTPLPVLVWGMRWPPVTLLPSHEPGEWGRTVTTHLHPLPWRLSSPARVLLLTSLHTLRIPFGAEESDCNQEKALSSFSPQWSLDRSRTPRGLDDELDTGDAKFFQVIEQLNSQKQWKQSEDFNPWTLYFREKEMEKEYRLSALPAFKYYAACTFLVFFSNFIIQMLVTNRPPALTITYSITFLLFFLLLFVCFSEHLTKCVLKGPKMLHWLPTLSVLVATRPGLRVALGTATILLVFSMAITSLVFLPAASNCPFRAPNVSFTASNLSWELPGSLPLISVPYSVHCCVLGFLSCSLFLHMSFELKLLLLLLWLAACCSLFLHSHAWLSDCLIARLYLGALDSSLLRPGVLKEPKLMGAISFFIFFFTLLVLARQNEYYCRLDFLWKKKLRQEQEETETMENLTRLLLENVLPAHVAPQFIGQNRRNEDLYHQSYECVCVLFASVPDFKEFYSESSINHEGLECLRLLNEIIADFDELLSKPKFSGVEKIKTICSTYMAATGLNATSGQDAQQDAEQSCSHLGTMVEFAVALGSKLDVINKHSFNNFRLRVGLNHGPVVAGVIGAQKPQYDIWGNTVNVASRMESTGVLGKIQVTEETACALQSLGYTCYSRGIIKVKGKGQLCTYFLNTDLTRTGPPSGTLG
ncbi:adenylate cyclase type 4 isoform X1 [Globicephala melas]|uniref:adenylate cyclase type 4 isoform X1 n=2 Tax=Globicephala melas TaxID=9731 RepID=UPI00293D5347|nr:adenylate cyclase type 4 isoform X1 [Globicephala melas]XP_060150645.1 adenylate cyclase type 4 isoform X1 [Globicephala melas]XP_060150646.1 adenylate cyclase type 4 isoform X1 [Globicephala melas]XP_060150647.1 adenylate cyclase type 4 isoform X1 [Globicephala melas]XP_060150648.1 adenylate cyclase type 4 isoform X1 [Globicephala melas]XP_060150649.1 adenylate cyclase type 4 isoform X1 [Globicephala melas]XP_060150650.1 adenylate cyclase type 4 isoform X1 [Globicephala melas]XP_06015065